MNHYKALWKEEKDSSGDYTPLKSQLPWARTKPQNSRVHSGLGASSGYFLKVEWEQQAPSPRPLSLGSLPLLPLHSLDHFTLLWSAFISLPEDPILLTAKVLYFLSMNHQQWLMQVDWWTNLYFYNKLLDFNFIICNMEVLCSFQPL